MVENHHTSHAEPANLLPGRPQTNGQSQGRGGPAPEWLDAGLDGLLVTDKVGVIVEADQTAADILRTRKEYLLGKPLPFFLAEGCWRDVYSLLARVRHHPEMMRDWRLRLRPRRDRDTVFVSVSMVPVMKDDQTLKLRWWVADLSRDASVERALRVERTFSDSLVDTVGAIILVIDGKGTILRCNPHACLVSGKAEHDLLGHDWVTLLPPADRPAARKVAVEALGSKTSKSLTGGLITAGGGCRSIAWNVKFMPRSPATDIALLVLGHDITELQQAQDRAVQAERLAAIGQMTAALAHEGRNLLQSSESCLTRLRWRLKDSPEALDLVARVQRAQRGLVRLFDDVRLYATPLRLEVGPCPLADVWREAWAEARAAVPDKDASLDEDAAGVDLWSTSDRFRLCQVFRNIFENSLSIGASPVHVQVSCRDTNLAGRPAVRLVVRDNGPGLNDEQRQRIFEPFYTTRPRGSGLGMAIAKRIIEAHGGQIAVGAPGPRTLSEGTVGVPGAEIIVVLPRGPS
jgi:PAS domain S-box-containing protein